MPDPISREARCLAFAVVPLIGGCASSTTTYGPRRPGGSLTQLLPNGPHLGHVRGEVR